MSQHTKYDEFVKLLSEHSTASPYEIMCRAVLDDRRFQTWPASINNKHHAYSGGLFDHTLEVVRAGISIATQPGSRANLDQVIVACVFHDYGKIKDYDETLDENGQVTWMKGNNYVMIHHLVESYAFFLEQSEGMSPHWRQQVGHCILAHHGRLEYGSPVVPVTAEAWAVHLADMTSVFCIADRKQK